MIEHEARDEGRRVGEFETTLALAEALGLPPETRIGPALAEVRKLRAERDALRAAVRVERLAAAEYAVAIDGGTDQEVARAWKRDTDAKQALLALLPPEAS